jgi:hypothetical protein
LDRDVTQRRCRLGPAGPVGTVLFLLCLARVCAAADFSADIASPHLAGAKIHTADGKVRLESPEATAGFFLIDSKAATAVFVRPAQRTFTDAGRSTRLTRVFIPVDPDAPCAQWQAAARNAGLPGAEGEWHCEKIGTGELDGRPTTQWRVTSPDQISGEYWIDRDLGFPVRVQTSDGALFTLENITVAAQAPELFTIPATYHKLDPRALIERIKHSDVWVEPPSQ